MKIHPMTKTFLALTLSVPVIAQVVLPPPNSQGWIRLLRTNNPGDFYIANNGSLPPAQSKLTFPNATYGLRGDTMQVTGSPGGQVYFNQVFSHYRIRYEMHFPGATGNCGMLLHVQQNDATTNGFPRSVESQGDPNQGMGQLWPIGDVWVTIRAHVVNGTMTYVPSDTEITYGGANWNSRVVAGKDGWANPSYAVLAARTGWVTQEADVHGSDSVADIVQDTVRIKYRQPRVSSGGTPNNVTKLLSSGLIAWQSEGRAVWYRNIEIMLYPQDPLYTPLYVEFNRRNTITPRSENKILMARNGLLIFRESGMTESLFDLRGHKTVSSKSIFSLPR